MDSPWHGFPRRDRIGWVQPTARAGFVEFPNVLAPSQMPGQRRSVLPWPYVEALRMDEAMHPLTILATGLYGRPLPNQNGAPIRLVVPWKYGFKSGKALVKINFTREMPRTTWNIAAPALLTGRIHGDWIKETTHRTGFWGLILLTATLAITPLRRVFGWNELQKYRRMLGLFVFFYICVHFLVIYVLLDKQVPWDPA